MDYKLPSQWQKYLDILDIAFQPILNIHTGEVFGVEALLRNYEAAGFKSIFSVFDRAFQESLLYKFDLALREKTFKKYKKISGFENIKLFYNIDNRLLDDYQFLDVVGKQEGNTKKMLKKLDIPKENLFFEISERYEISSTFNMDRVLQHYKDENYSIAIDDFGVGYSGYKLLYDSTPDIIKIDRFFLQDVEKSIKKKLMVRSITHLAIQLGIKVIAEGVETKAEFLTCKEIGCHLVQGYLIQKPTQSTNEIHTHYEEINKLIKKDKRVQSTNKKISHYLEEIEPICINTDMAHVIEYFKINKINSIVPIVDKNAETMGILHEKTIKKFLYSPYGIALLSNDNSKKTKLKQLVEPCGSADINSDITTIIELFSNNPESSGITITKSSKYHGFLSARSIISIMNEESLLLARDQNPLTKLPGNSLIEKYIQNSSQTTDTYILCYFDLDNFKAFNDVYGFRNGDRVIQLFADLLKKSLSHEYFKAHIGGDDFFSAFKDVTDENFDSQMSIFCNILKQFAENVREFYSKEDIELGYIKSTTREGFAKNFPLLTASASIIVISPQTSDRTVHTINDMLSIQKKVSKCAPNHIALSSLL